jgi:hypothetical protein
MGQPKAAVKQMPVMKQWHSWKVPLALNWDTVTITDIQF